MELEEWVRAEADGLAKYAAVLAGNRHLAECVLSDALLYVVRHWSRIERMENPRAYARKAVTSAFLDRCRAAARAPQPQANLDSSSVAAHPEHRELPQVRVEELIDLNQLVAKLPPKERTAIVLRYYLDFDTNEIAENLGVSSAQVRTLLSRGRQHLRLLDNAQSE